MKKILYFIIIFLLVITKAYVKASEVTLVKERIGDLYTYYYDENYGRNRFLYLNKYLFGENYAYCLELGKGIDSNIYTYSTSFNELQMSTSDLEYIKLVSYYGYDYPGHKTDRYYMAAQELIWIKLSNIDVEWAINMNSHNLMEVEEEKQEILRLVKSHNIKPSFDNNTIDIVKGENITLVDTNNVLSNYTSNNKYVQISGNILTIDGDIDVNKIELKKNDKTNKVFLLYTNGKSQKMMSSGSVEPITSKINLNIINGSITIHKKDKEGGDKPQGEASLNGAKYNLYDDTGAVKGSFVTGEKETVEGLSLGEYFLKEVTPSEGYMLDDTIYTVNITKDNPSVEITVYEEVIKRKVDIFKSLASSETGLLAPEVNAQFEVYDKDNNLIKKLCTDNDGYMSIILPYGTYTLKQITSQESYEKIKDYQIIIDKYDERPIYKLFTDAEIKTKVKIIKRDYDTKEIITNSNSKFKIYDVKNNKYVSFNIYYPENKILDTFEVINGVFTTPEGLPFGTYRLYEVDDKMDGYLYNDEGIEFKIGEDTNFINDEAEGQLFEVTFYNKPAKGKIEIYKYGEDIEYQENTYKYKETLLGNVTFGLYAQDDIYQNKNLIYKKNDIVKEITTDDNGYAMIDNLLLGNYYLKELSSAKDNKVTDTYYNINLTYEDQYTEKVLESIDVYNYINKGGIVINKFDKDTNSPLKNTLIEIRTLDNKVIYKGYTDEKGQIIINDLKYGDYYLAETEASTGYQLLEEKIPFTIDKEITTIDIYNERIPVPNTGIRINVYTIIPIISMLVSIIILLIIHNKKRFNILLITVIFLSLTVESIYYIKSYSDKAQNTKAVEAFFTNKISTNYNEKYRYNSILEIPSINLKRGILDINNEYNTAKYNIELIKENTNLIVLASHNGNYYNSFFGHLNNLELGDEINYYKNGIKYKYIYTDSYEIKKDGYADLYHKNDQKSIILITCKDNTDDGQVVHIGYLKDSTPF